MLFADDAAVAAHTQSELQTLMDRFAQACTDFGLTISLKKTNILVQGTAETPCITINNYELDVVNEFTYLGSTISNNLSLAKELDRRIGKAATTFARLSTRVWKNSKLTIKTKVEVYNACVLSTLLYGSEAWTTYSSQEQRLNTFHLRSLRRLLGISWRDRIPNTVVLSRTGLPSMYTLLRQRRLRWLGHVRRMEDGRIPKDLLYGELSTGERGAGRPQLRFRDVCKRDLKAIGMDTVCWEELATDRSKWRSNLHSCLKTSEESLTTAAEVKRAQRKKKETAPTATTINTVCTYVCNICNRHCLSRIGLYSHSKHCQKDSV